MKTIDTTRYQTHVTICTNERQSPAACCKAVGGLQFYEALKQRVKGSSFASTVKVTRTGCLGACNTVGCTVIIHLANQTPKAFNEVTLPDMEQIWKEITGS